MRQPTPRDDWPESWRVSYHYDKMELWRDRSKSGYAYAYKERLDTTIRLVTECAAPPARILDVAAAQGNFSLRLSEKGYRVVWNDLREDLIDYVALKHEYGDIQFLPGNIFDLEVDDAGQFDVVLITEIIEHVAHPNDFLCKVASFLKPQGAIVMTTPNGQYLRNNLPRFSDCADPSVFESVQFKPDGDGHIFLLHADEVLDIASEANLRVEKIEYHVNPLTNGHMKLRYVLPLIPRGIVEVVEQFTTRLPIPIKQKLCTNMALVLRLENGPT